MRHKKETFAELKARTIQLRKDVVKVVEEHGQLTCHQIARLLNLHGLSISACCGGLVRANWLENGPPARSESKNSHLVQTFVRGPNPDPVSDEYDLFKKHPYVPKIKTPKPEHDPYNTQGLSFKKEVITADDMAWMKKYRRQREQRYERFGEVAPRVY